MLSSPEKLPAHEVVYRHIRDQILYGDLPPGHAVTIQGLVGELGVSMTPVREAIRRLTAEGALDLHDNRRVSVPGVDPARFSELAYARLVIEPKLTEIAAKNMLPQDIDSLARIDGGLNQAIELGDVKNYMRLNHGFHFSLYAHAKSDILLPIAETLWLRYGPLYRIISGKYGTSNLIDQHEEAISALRQRDPISAANAIRRDIEQGFEIVRQNFGWAAI